MTVRITWCGSGVVPSTASMLVLSSYREEEEEDEEDEDEDEEEEGLFSAL